MRSEAVTVAPKDDYPLYTTAKRYWLPEQEALSLHPHALTLVLLHSTSFHKETWEPALEQLFRLASQPGSVVKIREAWALDCPNHGVSSQLNEKALMRPEFHNNCTSSVGVTCWYLPCFGQLPARSMPKLFIVSSRQGLIRVQKSTFASGIWLELGIRLEEILCESLHIFSRFFRA